MREQIKVGGEDKGFKISATFHATPILHKCKPLLEASPPIDNDFIAARLDVKSRSVNTKARIQGSGSSGTRDKRDAWQALD